MGKVSNLVVARSLSGLFGKSVILAYLGTNLI